MDSFYCVVTFHSTYHALNFEKIVKAKGINLKLLPVPRQVSTSCGTAAEVPCDKRQEILEICLQNHIEIAELHKIVKPSKNNWLSKLISLKT